MAPTAPLRTYSRKHALNRRNSVDVFDALLAENICKRKQAEVTNKRQKRKRGILIKELPPPDENHHLMADSFSTSFGTDNTFDRLRKEPICQELSNIKLESKHNSTKELSNPEEQLNKNENQTNLKPERTLEKSVNISLFVERIAVRKPEISTLSSLSSMNDHTTQNSKGCNIEELSFEPMFSHSFRNQPVVTLCAQNRPIIACSTPKKVPLEISNTLSPIFNNTHQKSLIEKSYDEIKKWNFKPPDFEAICSIVPKVKKKPPQLIQSHKNKSILKMKSKQKILSKLNMKAFLNKWYDYRKDWKFQQQPKVIIENNLEVLGITESVKIKTPMHVEGFTSRECDQSKSNAINFDKMTSIYEKSCNQLQPELCYDSSKVSQPLKDSPICYITLRKRTIVKGTKPKLLETDLELNKVKRNVKQDKIDVSTKNKTKAHNEIVLKLEPTIDEFNNVTRGMRSLPTNKKPIPTTSDKIIRRTTKTLQYTTGKTMPIKKENDKIDASKNTEDSSKECNVLNESGALLLQDLVTTYDKLPSSLNVEPNDSSKPDLSSPLSATERKFSNIPDIIPETPPQNSKSVTRTKYFVRVKSCVLSNTSKSISEDDKSKNETEDDVIFIESLQGASEQDPANSSNSNGCLSNDASLIIKFHNYSKQPKDDEVIIDLVSSDDESSHNEDATKNIPNSTTKETNVKPINSTEKYKSSLNQEPLLLKLGKSWRRSLIKTNKNDSKISDAVGVEDDSIINVDKSDDENECNLMESVRNSLGIISNINQVSSKEDVSKLNYNKINETIEVTQMHTEHTDTRQSQARISRAKKSQSILNRRNLDNCQHNEISFAVPTPLTLKPGKPWRRSLLDVRRTFNLIKDCSTCTSSQGCICTCTKCSEKPDSSRLSVYRRRLSVKIIPEAPLHKVKLFNGNTTILEDYASTMLTTYGSNTAQVAVYQEESVGDSSVVRTKEHSIHESQSEIIVNPSVTARDIVLQRCGQTEPILFEECYSPAFLKHCFKIGEGVYGEVFLFRNSNGTSSVMKVIPIEGSQMINGEHQKKFSEILSEIIIAMELSDLRNGTENSTCGFSEVEKVRCVQGRYPSRLLELWELYDENRGSENDSPDIFKEDQLYIVLELANAGQDMEAFIFSDSSQTLSLFKQTACSLAIAEESFQFEHRDLHWGNILISQAYKVKQLKFCLNGQDIEIETNGIKGSIIDFTLSRITHDGVCIFNDLSLDPDLFSATGDYQFEIYKKMQKHNGNEWQHFEPYTNILWLHYVLDKMTRNNGVRYNNKSLKKHKEGLAKLVALKNRMLKYSSATELVTNEFM